MSSRHLGLFLVSGVGPKNRNGDRPRRVMALPRFLSAPGRPEANALTRQRRCPACHNLVTIDEHARGVDATPVCPQCGAKLPTELPEPNPYAAPSELDPRDSSLPPLVPPTLIGKFVAAFQLFFSNFNVLGPVILFISLPANLLIKYYAVTNPNSNDQTALLQLTFLVSGLFGPIPIAAIHYTLSRRMLGERVTFFEALSQGMNHWIPLLLAQVVKGLIILLGIFAFIVPAFYFAVRYALLDPVVVLEHARDPRQRSSQLVQGKGWEILYAFFIYFIMFLGVAVPLQSIPDPADPTTNIVVGTVIDCTLDLFAAISTIVMFLYYWEARQAEAKLPADEIV